MNLQVGKKKNFTRVKVCEKKKMVVNYTRLKQMQGFFFFFSAHQEPMQTASNQIKQSVVYGEIKNLGNICHFSYNQ